MSPTPSPRDVLLLLVLRDPLSPWPTGEPARGAGHPCLSRPGEACLPADWVIGWPPESLFSLPSSVSGSFSILQAHRNLTAILPALPSLWEDRDSSNGRFSWVCSFTRLRVETEGCSNPCYCSALGTGSWRQELRRAPEISEHFPLLGLSNVLPPRHPRERLFSTNPYFKTLLGLSSERSSLVPCFPVASGQRLRACLCPTPGPLFPSHPLLMAPWACPDLWPHTLGRAAPPALSGSPQA